MQLFHGDILMATDTDIHYLALWGSSTHLMLVSLQSVKAYPTALIIPAGALLKHHLVTSDRESQDLRDRFYTRHQPRCYPHFSYASLMPLLPEEFVAHALLQAAADRRALPERSPTHTTPRPGDWVGAKIAAFAPYCRGAYASIARRI